MYLDESQRISIALRTRRLYALAFASCGSSHRAVQRCIGRDVRSLVVARDVPTLGCVIDLSRALGMRAGAIIDILSRDAPDPEVGTPESRRWPVGGDEETAALAHMIDIADLTDDAMQLERVAEVIPRSQGELRRALHARALTARGAIDRAIMLVRPETDAIVGRKDADLRLQRLLDAVLGEVAAARPDAVRTSPLGETVRALLRRPPVGTAPASGDAGTMHPAFHTRAETHRAACAVALASDDDVAVAALASLADALEDSPTLGQPVATAWAASTTALAALALIGHRLRDSSAARTPLRLAVRAGFALEDLLRCGDPLAEHLACARRARMILAERAVRIACGEDPWGVADTADLAEFQMAALRFPDADPSLHRFRDFDTFSQPSEVEA
jgi:hypothetical protein